MTSEDPTIARACQLLQLDSADRRRPLAAGLDFLRGAGGQRRRLVVAIGSYCLLAVILLKVWLVLPLSPNTAADAFRFGGSGLDLLLFGLMMLWLGWGGAWLGRACATAEKPVLYLLVGLPVLTLIAYVFLLLAFTPEFLESLLGPNILFYRVTEQGVLGDWGLKLFGALGLGNAQSIVAVLEPLLRFSALILPLVILLGIFSAIATVRKHHTLIMLDAGWKAGGFVAIFLLCLLYVCKLIVVDWAPNDSVAKAITGGGAGNAIGWLCLFALLLTLCSAGAFFYHYWQWGKERVGARGYVPRKRVALRVYSSQLEFLQRLSTETRQPVSVLVNRVIDYFNSEVSEGPDRRERLQSYIDDRNFNRRVTFAPDKLSVRINADSFLLLASLNGNGSHSESRVFRKLLEILVLDRCGSRSEEF